VVASIGVPRRPRRCARTLHFEEQNRLSARPFTSGRPHASQVRVMRCNRAAALAAR
jgi:hypothetical protein